jgi:integrator complex subunit 6
MKAMGSPNFVPEQIENCMMSYTVVSYLKKLKNQAKMEYDRLVASVGQARPLYPPGIRVSSSNSAPSILRRPDFHQLLARHGSDLSSLTHELASTDYDTFALVVPGDKNVNSRRVYTNPFDISRKDLLTHIRRMRVNYMKAVLSGSQLQEAESHHNMSVQDMGNYQEYLRRMPQPLREIETQPARQHTFGNPFKVNKNIMIDEADEAMPGQQTSRKRMAAESSASPRPNKRKPGPLPKGVSVRLLLSPVREVQTPPPSPVYQPFDSMCLQSPQTEYDEDYDDEVLVLTDDELDPGIQQQQQHPQENNVQTNHMYSETNGELSVDVSIDELKPSLASSPNAIGSLRRQLSVSSAPATPPLNGLKTYEHNRKIREKAVVETKRPGKDHLKLFHLLGDLQGSAEERCRCIRVVIHEAERFKRLSLVRQLNDLVRTCVTPPSLLSSPSPAGSAALVRTSRRGTVQAMNCNHVSGNDDGAM